MPSNSSACAVPNLLWLGLLITIVTPQKNLSLEALIPHKSFIVLHQSFVGYFEPSQGIGNIPFCLYLHLRSLSGFIYERSLFNIICTPCNF